MTPKLNHDASSHDDQATRLRELVARLDHARDGAAPRQSARSRRAVPSSGSSEARVPAARERTPERSARIVSIASGKGGVGKTSMSVNLCAALAKLGLRVTLLDGDFGLANADVLCGVRVHGHMGQVLDGTRRIEDILIEAPGGFRLAPGAAELAGIADTGLRERALLIERLSAIELHNDILVIDCGAGIGQGVSAFLDAADLPIVVTTPEPTAIADAYALIKQFLARASDDEAIAAPRLLVNQALNEQDAVRTHQRINGVSLRFLDRPISMIGWTPEESVVGEAVRRRTPFVVASPRSDASKAVRRLAGSVQRELGVAPAGGRRRSGLLGRMFGLDRPDSAKSRDGVQVPDLDRRVRSRVVRG